MSWSAPYFAYFHQALVKFPRSVLFVCYDFPALSAAGVIRTYQFAKHLAALDWQPIILTAQTDEERDDNIEKSDGPLSCPKFTAPLARFPLPFRTQPFERPQPIDRGLLASRRVSRFLCQSAARFVVPDGKLNWLRPAAQLGFEIASQYPIQACFSVSPRPTAHLVAHRIAKRLQLPWVADFALPWSDAYWLQNRPRLLQRLDRRLEDFVVNAAQHITVAYEEIKDNMDSRSSASQKDKITVIPTGFEEDLFAEPTPPSARKFTVVYPGNHFCEQGRHGEQFLLAIDDWIGSHPDLQEHVEFVFMGKRDDALLRARAAMTHPNVIRVEPLTFHRSCVRAMRSSHACVVNAVGNRVPAKLYECMRAKRRILALTEPGSELANIVRSYDGGIVVSSHDRSAIRQALQTMFQQRNRYQDHNLTEPLFSTAYSSKQGSETLCRILDKLSLPIGALKPAN